MPNRLAFLSGCAAFLLLLTGCAGGNNPIMGGPAKTADVYVAGYQVDANGKFSAVVWKNGALTTLPDDGQGSEADAIAVSGQNVYVAGTVFNGTHRVATLWKNGSPVAMTDGSREAFANAIFLSGNDVYVAGSEASGSSDGYEVAEYWKNGVPVLLTDGTEPAEAHSIFVSGPDVYVAGFQNEKTQTGPTSYAVADVATYWKNGVPATLTGVLQPSEAWSIFISGSDVYAAGCYHQDSSSGATAAYWKNGALIPLTDSTNTAARSIVVSGPNVYSAGDNSNVPEMAYYWKNGTETQLPKPSKVGGAAASQIVVSGGDVYVAGDENGNGNSVAVYWKNGTAVPLTDGTNPAYALGIAVVPPPQ